MSWRLVLLKRVRISIIFFMFFKDLKQFNLPEAEKKVLKFWREKKVFEKSLQIKRRGSRRGGGKAVGLLQKKEFVFYEGPPTANGRPGIHHVLARSFKDVVLRYKTMRGYYVPRRAGWDTHGLPVEIQVEKELGLKSKKDIEKYGIAEFNKKCRESVWKFKDEWEKLTERMGFWLDLKNPYITYEKDYIETLWWIIAQFWKKKLLYKGYRVAPWCPRCGTALSSHEMALGYKMVVDDSVYVKFRVKKVKGFKKPVYILSWTTTPWTLPGNVALAVGEKIDYVFLDAGVEFLVLAKDLIEKVGVVGKVVKKVKGEDLVGLEYEPLFDVKPLTSKFSYKVYSANFVTTTDGTGVVHTAVMYGEDDYQLGTKLDLPKHHTVDEQGRFTKDVKELSGLFVKSSEAEKRIFDYLKKRSNFLKIEEYEHEYPHCWRCSTPLLYYARESWFVAMSKLKKRLLANNSRVNWVPEHVKEGRFGEWLKEAKDWNFSRERYWGTPLPIWECGGCRATEVVEGLNDLSKKAITRNQYFFMRHGEATSNIDNICVSRDTKQYTSHLTRKGIGQVQKIANLLKKEKIDFIFSSPIERAKETAIIVASVIGVKVVFDKRIAEINVGVYNGKHVSEYGEFLKESGDDFKKIPPRGESRENLKRRVRDFFSVIDKKYKGKKILIISHGDPLWMLKVELEGLTRDEALRAPYPLVGRLYSINWGGVPRGEDGVVDLHRPYVDEIKLRCEKCGREMDRVKGLADVWFDSGSMPFAQDHWPFRKKNESRTRKSELKKDRYPADYIVEAVDQTRGWFYTLLAVATALGMEEPYKNVICLGHINDKNGQKMSKSKGNIVDPWVMAEKYGMDAVRWYMYSATPPGEPKNFDEQEILKTYRRVHAILWNSLVFYQTYSRTVDTKRKVLGEEAFYASRRAFNVLDQWITARLDETVNSVTKNMDSYKIREAVLEIERLTDDLSRWYIRRSRRRLQKQEDKKDCEACFVTLGYVVGEMAKLMAPFSPFFSEVVNQQIKKGESIHLLGWPSLRKTLGAKSRNLLKEMEEVRRLATLALAKRAEVGIKVRQPLAEMRVLDGGSRIKNKDLLEVLAEEINVKRVVYQNKLSDEVELDVNITAELREEGVIRELTRAIQDLRQKGGLRSSDTIVLMFEVSEGLKGVIQRNENLLKREVGAKEIKYQRLDKFGAEVETKLEEESVWIGIRKI